MESTVLETGAQYEAPPQFDAKTRVWTVMRTEAAGKTEVAMMWPSDELWIKRAKSRKVLTRLLGRGQQEPDVEAGDSDLDLYRAVRCEDSPDLTAAEASLFVNRAAVASVISTELGSTEATVVLKILRGIEVTHRLRIPTARQAKDCSKAMDRFIGMPHNVYSNTMHLSVTAALWDQLQATVENYLNEVPIIHKDAVIRELFQALEREAGEGEDEKGF